MSLSSVAKRTDVKQVTVPFEPPLSGYDEVKPRLLGMKLDAEEALGMVRDEYSLAFYPNFHVYTLLSHGQTRRPQINSFEVPRDMLTTLSMLLLLTYVTFSAPTSSSSLHNIGPWIRAAVGGISTLRYIWAFVAVIHGAEALYIALLCKRHATGIVNGVSVSRSIAFGADLES